MRRGGRGNKVSGNLSHRRTDRRTGVDDAGEAVVSVDTGYGRGRQYVEDTEDWLPIFRIGALRY